MQLLGAPQGTPFFVAREFRRSGRRRAQAPRRCRLQSPASVRGVAWARRRRQHGGQRSGPHQIRPNSQYSHANAAPARSAQTSSETAREDSGNATWAHGNANRVNERLPHPARSAPIGMVVRRRYCAATSRGKRPRSSRAHAAQRRSGAIGRSRPPRQRYGADSGRRA